MQDHWSNVVPSAHAYQALQHTLFSSIDGKKQILVAAPPLENDSNEITIQVQRPIC
jgi:hypothetical protein